MQDPKEIEGSPERAEDRGREEDLGFQASDKPSLGDPAVVRGLVSEFAGQVIAARRAFNAGELDGQQAKERIGALATEYGNIIMGRDQAYAALSWNNPARLGRRIGLVTPPMEGVEDPGQALFLTVAASLIEVAVAHEEARMPDVDAQRHIQAALEDTANLILGVR